MAAASSSRAAEDTDSEEDEDEVGWTAQQSLVAQRALLQFRCRQWDKAFAAQHGRPATYEDKKLARDFQRLRAQLRQVDTDLVIERGKLPDMSYEITVRDILSTRRMRTDTSRTAATVETARSGRSVALGASLRDRERSKRHLRSMHSHLAASHRQAKLVAALGADVVRTDAPAHCECKQLPGYLREAALKRCESSVVDHHQRVYEETARVRALTLRKAQKSAPRHRPRIATRDAKRARLLDATRAAERPVDPAVVDAMQPIQRAREVALQMLKTDPFQAMVSHWFDRNFSFAATHAGAIIDLPMLALWGGWRRGECAEAQADGSRYDTRIYSSPLHEVSAGVDAYAACHAGLNTPTLFERAIDVGRCDVTDGGLVTGEVYVKDTSCGSCPGEERYCMDGSEATDAEFAEAGMGLDASLRTGDGPISLRAVHLRSQLRLGWPLEGYENCFGGSCNSDQEIELQEWAEEKLAPVLDQLNSKTAGGVKFSAHFEPLYEAGLRDLTAHDIILAALPLPIGAIYLILYTGSLFLALVGVLQLAVAWPTALFFYRYVFRAHHVESLTLMAAPVTVAFSLDALALFFDSWHASTLQPASVLQDLITRLSWVLWDAGIPCIVTFVVGIVAFAASGLSEWLPIAHFGAFCAIELTVQLVIAIVLVPTAVVVYHNWLEPKRNIIRALFPRCSRAARMDGEKNTFSSAVRALSRPIDQTSTELHHASRLIEATLGTPEPSAADTALGRGSPTWPLPKLLGRYALPLIDNKFGRRVLLAFFAVLLAAVCVAVSFARAQKCLPPYVKESHSLVRTRAVIEREFDVSAYEDTARATLLWGVEGVERGGTWWGVNLLRNSSFFGEVVLRDPHIVFDEAAQAHLASVCEELRLQTWVQRDPERALEPAGGDVQCFVEEFRAWVMNASGLETHGFGPEFPVPSEREPLRALSAFLHSRQRTQDTRLAEPAYAARWQAAVGLDDELQLRFVSVSFDLTLRRSACLDEANDYFDLVEGFTADVNARAPLGIGAATPSADGLWASLQSQALLPEEARVGAMRASAFAIGALFLLSGNVVTTLLASVALFCSTLTLLALLVVCGWELGTTEAVLACSTPALMAPPISLVVRAYLQSMERHRSRRAEHALLRGGAPVISSCVAMAAAFAPLLGCSLVHAFKTAVALILAAFCVALWAGIFLPAVLGELGPTPSAVDGLLFGSLHERLAASLRRRWERRESARRQAEEIQKVACASIVHGIGPDSLVHTSRVARAARPYEETAQELAEKALFVDRDKACTRAAKRPPMPVDLDNEKLVEAIALDLLEDVPNAEKMAAVYSQHARSLLDA